MEQDRTSSTEDLELEISEDVVGGAPNIYPPRSLTPDAHVDVASPTIKKPDLKGKLNYNPPPPA